MTAKSQFEQTAANDGPCSRPDCTCCAYRTAMERRVDGLADMVDGLADMVDGLVDMMNGFLEKLGKALAADTRLFQKVIDGLAAEKKRYSALNRRLNVKVNGIRTVAVRDRKPSGKRGRPRGQKPTINKRPAKTDREETNDLEKCPDCGCGLSKWSDEYDRVVRHMRISWETVLHHVKRRYCKSCKGVVSASVPGTMAYSRASANYDALMVHLNIEGGLSCGKLARTSSDALKRRAPRSSMYRNKISVSGALAPDYGLIREMILKEPNLHVDEL